MIRYDFSAYTRGNTTGARYFKAYHDKVTTAATASHDDITAMMTYISCRAEAAERMQDLNTTHLNTRARHATTKRPHAYASRSTPDTYFLLSVTQEIGGFSQLHTTCRPRWR